MIFGIDGQSYEIDVLKFATDLDVILRAFRIKNGYECMTTTALMLYIEEIAKEEKNEDGESDSQARGNDSHATVR